MQSYEPDENRSYAIEQRIRKAKTRRYIIWGIFFLSLVLVTESIFLALEANTDFFSGYYGSKLKYGVYGGYGLTFMIIYLNRYLKPTNLDTSRHPSSFRDSLSAHDNLPHAQFSARLRTEESNEGEPNEAESAGDGTATKDGAGDASPPKLPERDRGAPAKPQNGIYFEFTIHRLRSEIADLSKRGRLNLIIGIAITAIGVGVLAYYVLVAPPPDSEGYDFYYHITTRLSLVLLIEVFAYFFLRLYKASLTEIKYYQNELTNIELIEIAFYAAADNKFHDDMKLVIGELRTTERNKTLEAGQTTVELESQKQKDETMMSLLKEVAELLKKFKTS